MAKVQGPLHSLSASGTFNDTITYQQRGPTSVAYFRTIPPDPHTPPQDANRILMYHARNAWKILPQNDKALFNNLAAELGGVSGYNLFIKHCFNIPYIRNPDLLTTMHYGEPIYFPAGIIVS